MTYESNDANRRVTDEDYRSTTGAGAYTTRPSNTGVIGAIIGVLAVVAIIFFVWRGYEGTNHASTPASAPATTSSTAPSTTPAPAPTPAAPAPAAPNPAAPAGGNAPANPTTP
jgi:hypothetical protein